MKKDLHCSISPDCFEYIDEVKSSNYLSNRTQAVELIIRQNKSLHEEIEELHSQNLEFVELLKKLKLASNSIDKNTKINQLMLNQLIIYSNTRMYNNTFSNQFIAASKIIEDEISSAKTKKEELKKKNIRQVKHSYVVKPEPKTQPQPEQPKSDFDDIDLDSIDWESMGIHPNNI